MPTYLPVFSSPAGEAETLRAYQAVLQKWTAPYNELTIHTQFGDTHVIASGPEGAPVVVLLHALFATATAWYANIAELSRQYRVYAVDVMGEANRSCPTRPITNLEEAAQWFEELLDNLGAQQVYLAGNSNGGFLSASFAMQLPTRVRKLVLIGPAATIHGMPQFYWHMFIPKMLAMFFPTVPLFRKMVIDGVAWMGNGLAIDPEWEKLFTLTMLHGSMTSRIMPRVYSREEFEKVTAPVLLVLGAKEVIYQPEQAVQAARRLIPNLQVEVIPQAHHITALAQPQAFNQALLRFFAEEDAH